MNRGHVTLVEIVAAAASRAAALAPESAGYLVLSLCDAIGCLPIEVDEAAVLVSAEGAVTLAHKGPALGGAEAARAMRAILARLLEVATGSTAALAAAARPRPAGGERGIEAVAAEIEAALVPVNRAAGKRTLARLSRETARALEAGLVVAAEPHAEPEPTDVMTVGPVSALASSRRPEPAREATPTVPDPGWVEPIPTGSIRIPVEIPPSVVHTLRTAAAGSDITEPGLPPVLSEEAATETPAPSMEELSSSCLVTFVEAPVERAEDLSADALIPSAPGKAASESEDATLLFTSRRAAILEPTAPWPVGLGMAARAVEPRTRVEAPPISVPRPAVIDEPAHNAETRAWLSQGSACLAVEASPAAELSHASLLQFEFDVLSPSDPNEVTTALHASAAALDPQALSRTFLQHVPVDETPPSQRRSHTGPLGTVLGGVELSGSLGGADVLACVHEPSLTPPPASASASAPAAAPVSAPVPAPAPAPAAVAPAVPRRDRTDDLLDRFGRSPEAEAALMRATARSLKALAGLDPTPPPLAPTIHIPTLTEDKSPAWLPPRPRTETELSPSPLVPAPRRLRSRIALPFALLVAVVAGASAVLWTHPELFPWRSNASVWGALDLP